MKRIICTVTNDLSYDQRMIRICSSLSAAGYEVELVGRELATSIPLQPKPFAQSRLRCVFNKGKLFYIEYNIRLLFYLLFHSFDLVCAVDLDTLAPGCTVARLKRKKCIFDAHEYFTEVPEVVERKWVKRTWQAVADLFIPGVDLAYTVCESLAEIFTRRHGKEFRVIRNMPVAKSLSGNKQRNAESPFILLYQGVLNEGRGLEEAIRAVACLRDVEFWLAGEGDLSVALRNQVNEMQLDDRVKFLGKIPPEDLHAITCQADAGLNLLRPKGLNYYYSLANKAFDYIQAGIPSLAMDFPEYRRINRQFEVFLLLEALTPEVVAESISRLKDNRDYYMALKENCHAARTAFIWEKEERKLLELYKTITHPTIE